MQVSTRGEWSWGSTYLFFSEPLEANWCVNLPSEAVLFFDSLNDLFAGCGKVLAVHDINEYVLIISQVEFCTKMQFRVAGQLTFIVNFVQEYTSPI